MGRAPCCEKVGLKRGAWSPEEDSKLVAFIREHGHPNWRALPKQAGLLRCGKSCRLRWINYLRPDIKRGNFTEEEEELVIRVHQSLGNRWSAIAAQLPGRTDNEIKNIWHTHLKKKLAGRKDGGKQRKPKLPAAAAAAAVEDGERPDASPGRSSSTGTWPSSLADNAATAATTSASTESSSAELPDIDESFWSSEVDLGLMDVDGQLGLAGAPSRSDDMEFWLKLLLETGDMKDLAVM